MNMTVAAGRSGGTKRMSGLGVGPVYVLVTFGLTAIGWFVRGTEPLAGGAVTNPAAAIAMTVIGAALLVSGAALWASVVFGRRSILGYVRRGELCTSGVYRYVRNPCYSGVMIAAGGAVVMMQNLWLLVLLPVFYLVLTLLVKCTEERWLLARFGSAYADYMKRVNRCVPWPRRISTTKNT